MTQTRNISADLERTRAAIKDLKTMQRWRAEAGTEPETIRAKLLFSASMVGDKGQARVANHLADKALTRAASADLDALISAAVADLEATERQLARDLVVSAASEAGL